MKADLKRLHSPDIDLENDRLTPPFCVLVQAMVGPEGSDAEESFEFLLCDPSWLEKEVSSNIVVGLHYIFVSVYDYEAIRKFISNLIGSYEENSWEDLASRLSFIGKWEFDDYNPTS